MTDAKTFVVKQNYAALILGERIFIITVTVMSRTAKTIKIKTSLGTIKTCRILSYKGVEYIRPDGNYVMSIIITANDPPTLTNEYEEGYRIGRRYKEGEYEEEFYSTPTATKSLPKAMLEADIRFPIRKELLELCLLTPEGSTVATRTQSGEWKYNE
jgi:hypothetical protein